MRLSARIAAARTTIPTSLIAISYVFRSDSPLLPQFRRAQRLRLRRARHLPDEQGAQGPHSISAAYTQDQHSILAACTQSPNSISAAYAPIMHAYRRTIGVTTCMRIFLYFLQARDPNTLWMPRWSQLHSAQLYAEDNAIDNANHGGGDNHHPGLINQG